MASPRRNGRPRFRSRPLYATVFLMTLLATYALFLKGPQPSRSAPRGILGARAADDSCDQIHEAKDQCAFAKANCLADEPGLLSYFGFYYCTLPQAKPIAFALLALWLGLLFSTIGIAASDFFSVNLSTIASVLGLPESLAGVTFLAFGNGSPDVFSTFAAMNSNSGSMAIGELIGAAGFITAVVAGSMGLVREFRVSQKTFVRDIVFFILAISFTMIFVTDGQIHLWECGSMIGFYIFYVCFVVAWHWFSARRRRRTTKEAASRNHFSVASSTHFGDDIEPYRDDVDEEEGDAGVGRRGRSQHPQDINALEFNARTNAGTLDHGDDDDDEHERLHVASEMTSSMRVNRPRGKRAHSTITPIRPSLIGALEFRSVLSSLQRSRNMRMAPLVRGHSYHNSAGILARPSANLPTTPEEPYRDDPASTTLRDRALSSGDTPRNLHGEGGQPLSHPLPSQLDDASHQRSGSVDYRHGHPGRSPSVSTTNSRLATVADRAIAASERAPSPAVSSTRGGHLAPPGAVPRPLSLSSRHHAAADAQTASPPTLSLLIPSPNLAPSQASSPSLSPFPRLQESPIHGGQQAADRSHPQLVPAPRVEAYGHISGLDPPESPKPVKWWPYYALPPPHVLWGMFLPTLQGWREKSIWDKAFSILSAPSVFLLVITLPVVETEAHEDDECDDGNLSTYAHSGVGINPPTIAIESQAAIQPETEWQEYRRRAHSVVSRSSSTSRNKSRLGASPYYSPAMPHDEYFPAGLTTGAGGGGGSAQPLSEAGLGSEPTTEDDSPQWNRWLVAVQIFTGPLFTDFIIWSKYMDQPVKVLIRMVLYSLIGSLVLLAILLLFTTPDKKPKYHFLFCFLGFIISIAWISTIAEEVVGILRAIGVILGMSEAILGLTVFAVGNSVGDLVADITVARLGYPVMALSACFGGPMLNILLGIGLGGTYMTIKSAKDHSQQHPGEPLTYKPYQIDVTGTLCISAITVLTTLVVLLILVPSSNWMMTKKIGQTLIALWSVGTVVSVVVEVTGVWEAVS